MSHSLFRAGLLVSSLLQLGDAGCEGVLLASFPKDDDTTPAETGGSEQGGAGHNGSGGATQDTGVPGAGTNWDGGEDQADRIVALTDGTPPGESDVIADRPSIPADVTDEPRSDATDAPAPDTVENLDAAPDHPEATDGPDEPDAADVWISDAADARVSDAADGADCIPPPALSDNDIPENVAAWEPANCNGRVTMAKSHVRAADFPWIGCTNGNIYNGHSDGSPWGYTWIRVDYNNVSGQDLPNELVTTLATGLKDIERKTEWVGLGATNSDQNLWKTVMGGQYWTSLALDGTESAERTEPIWTLSISPFNDVLYALTKNRTLVSTDSGVTWSAFSAAAREPKMSGLPLEESEEITAIGIPTTPSSVPEQAWVGTSNGFVYYTGDATSAVPTWTLNFSSVEKTTRRTKISRINVAPDDAASVYVTLAAVSSQSAWTTSDGGSTWDPISTPSCGAPSDASYYGLDANPVYAWTYYLVGSFGAFRTDDKGRTWYRIGPD
jgi:hypothetical protein